MLPAHHKQRPHAKTNGVYLCAIVSLAICLFVTFRYWKSEVNELLQQNHQLNEELSKRSIELAEEGVLLSNRQNKIHELEADLTKRESSISDLTASLEKEAAKSSDLAKKNEHASRDYNELEQLKSETESKLESCQKDLLEKTEVKQKKIAKLEAELKTAKSQVDVLTAQVQTHQGTTANVQHVQTTTATNPGATTVTKGIGQTETVRVSKETAKKAPDVIVVKSQEIPFVKTETIQAEEVNTVQYENKAYQLEAPEKREIGVKKDQEDEGVFHIQGATEMITEFRDESDAVGNRRSGNQNAQAETLSDALNIEAKEEISEATTQTTVQR